MSDEERRQQEREAEQRRQEQARRDAEAELRKMREAQKALLGDDDKPKYPDDHKK
jgi:hypothetical protein